MVAKAKTVDKTETKVIGAAPLSLAAIASNLADTFANDEEGMNDIEKVLEAKEVSAVSGQWMYLNLLRVLGKEKLDATPVPGVKIKNDDGTLNNNPDEYKVPKQGQTGEVSRYFHKDFADDLPMGKIIKAKLEAAVKMKDTNVRAAELDKAKYGAQQSALYKLVKQGFALHHQIEAVAAYPGVEFDWVYEQDKDGNDTDDYARTNKPISLTNVANNKVFCYCTVQQFLSYDVKAATDKGGTYKNLLDTASKEPIPGANTSVPKTVEEFASTVAGGLHFLEDDDKYQNLKKRLAKADKGSDALIQTMKGYMDLFTGALNSVPNLDARLKAMADIKAAANKVA